MVGASALEAYVKLSTYLVTETENHLREEHLKNPDQKGKTERELQKLKESSGNLASDRTKEERKDCCDYLILTYGDSKQKPDPDVACLQFKTWISIKISRE